ncbi:CoA transferase subunit A [Desulfosporosinus metallidurans]|uniref:Butyrate-acetoacetate CoA-transferase subunit A n=1 Tax=Desulfosporosinus metallidurans TaxID=1888891 RepID=A0A1Q8QWZ5_9FIRM|nr:3-oxoacid CoA-transferase subunit A [Desulfosporosinus metallidurans]OLN31858.1 Butyrate-acetoacetate CoA-transferase subunit A [Desulfosporosinus metallidurans]
MAQVITIQEAVDKVTDGMAVMVGGFIGSGAPGQILAQLAETKVKDLTLIANDTGVLGDALSQMVVNHRLKKVIASHIGTNKETGRQMNAGELEVVLAPQGTLVEQIRAAGAGLGGVLTPTGIGTVVEEGKQKVTVNGQEYLLEGPLGADVAIIKAYKADRAGNLVYRRAARNFNPVMATAAKTVIVEVEKLVEVGEIDPDEVMTPGIFVDYLVLSQSVEVKNVG